MVDHQVARHWDQELSQAGHNLMRASSSGDDYKAETLHCTGTANPYDVEESRADSTCGWLGPRIRPGRWHEKHIGEAFERHVADVAENGPIVHGRGAGRCECYYCRRGQTPVEMHETDQGASVTARCFSPGGSDA